MTIGEMWDYFWEDGILDGLMRIFIGLAMVAFVVFCVVLIGSLFLPKVMTEMFTSELTGITPHTTYITNYIYGSKGEIISFFTTPIVTYFLYFRDGHEVEVNSRRGLSERNVYHVKRWKKGIITGADVSASASW
jgi:hypothetical protein